MGFSLIGVRHDIASLTKFLDKADGIQANFERSLQVYTESTQEIVDYLLSLRPVSEEGYINFIASTEEVAQRLGLDLELNSIVLDSKSKSLAYKLSFYGSFGDLDRVLREFESLPYFIRIYSIDFEDLKFSKNDENQSKNVNLIIQVYVK
ncbi:hypothetical protein COU74_00565 [Candidatus Peregrinibacteria bacterium CG10_big_fil_rev_8_21_14_0_10_36_19]|nr:MAG: hypothetical protein COU74_00565 [Candidatus Peregrinibacteria bacterium CG10_big_fil_rev_8_21_14_0_10_36_19]